MAQPQIIEGTAEEIAALLRKAAPSIRLDDSVHWMIASYRRVSSACGTYELPTGDNRVL